MRKHNISTKLPFAFLALAVLLFAGASRAYAGATIVVLVGDGPNEGFNDPTPVAPLPSNPGTTLGQQRLYAFQYAANIWGATLDSPETIYIGAFFDPLAPNVLGQAGAWDIFSDFGSVGLFPGPEFAQTWYGSALADKRAGHDLDTTSPDIFAQFSTNFNFYLGTDNNHGPLNDLVAVLLHEFGHGLGFQNFVTEASGANGGPNFGKPISQTDIFARHTYDNTTSMTWDQMTQTQRQASAINFGNVVWNGANVTADAPLVLVIGSPEVRVLSPAAIAGPKQFGTAAFGPTINSLPSPVSATIVPAVDAANAAGPATTDGCTALTNAAAVAGKIALVERGTCGFAVKARNATNAGAVGVIIYNNAANAAAAPPGMADDGINGAFVTIPTVSVTRNDGLAIVGQPSAVGFLGVDLTRRAGADAVGRVRLYMPNPVVSGSSGSHYDTAAFRNLLMEPAISPDLTLELMRDVGWFPDADNDGKATDADCDDTSDFSPTVVIAGCDTGVTNFFFADGCTLSDKIQAIGAAATNHGQFVSGVSQLTNALKAAGLISGAQKAAIQSCAAGASIP